MATTMVTPDTKEKKKKKPEYRYGHILGKNIGDQILNLDKGFQDKVFKDEGLIPPPEIDEIGHVQQSDGPASFEKEGQEWTQVGEKIPGSAVGPYYKIRNVSHKGDDPGYVNRILIGTPTTGNIRMEWALARYGQIIPTNWSQIQMIQYLASYAPSQYLVADAQNLIIKEFIEKNFEWLFLVEHDVILPVDAFVRINAHIRSEKNPVVSGLYYTKSIPAEPMIYRGRGNSYYTQWKFGDYVYVDGVPTGCLLIHRSVLKSLWDESEEYVVPGSNVKAKQVFVTPREMWYDDLTGQWNATTGTSDLDWCSRIIKGGHLAKAGWKKHAKLKYPFMVDTNIYCKQIDEEGVTYPVE
jgi:hypothetical protein